MLASIWSKAQCLFTGVSLRYVEELRRFVSLYCTFFLVVFCIVPLFRRIPYPPFSLQLFLCFNKFPFSIYIKKRGKEEKGQGF